MTERGRLSFERAIEDGKSEAATRQLKTINDIRNVATVAKTARKFRMTALKEEMEGDATVSPDFGKSPILDTIVQRFNEVNEGPMKFSLPAMLGKRGPLPERDPDIKNPSEIDTMNLEELMIQERLLHKKNQELNLVLRRECVVKLKLETKIEDLRRELEIWKTSGPADPDRGTDHQHALLQELNEQRQMIAETKQELHDAKQTLRNHAKKYSILKRVLLSVVEEVFKTIHSLRETLKTVTTTTRTSSLFTYLKTGLEQLPSLFPNPPIASSEITTLSDTVNRVLTEFQPAAKLLKASPLPLISLEFTASSNTDWEPAFVGKYQDGFLTCVGKLGTLSDKVKGLVLWSTAVSEKAASLQRTLDAIQMRGTASVLSQTDFSDKTDDLKKEHKEYSAAMEATLQELRDKMQAQERERLRLEDALKKMGTQLNDKTKEMETAASKETEVQVLHVPQQTPVLGENNFYIAIVNMLEKSRLLDLSGEKIAELQALFEEAMLLSSESARATWKLMVAKQKARRATVHAEHELSAVPPEFHCRISYCYRCGKGPYGYPESSCASCKNALYYGVVASVAFGPTLTRKWNTEIKTWLGAKKSLIERKNDLVRKVSNAVEGMVSAHNLQHPTVSHPPLPESVELVPKVPEIFFDPKPKAKQDDKKLHLLNFSLDLDEQFPKNTPTRQLGTKAPKGNKGEASQSRLQLILCSKPPSIANPVFGSNPMREPEVQRQNVIPPPPSYPAQNGTPARTSKVFSFSPTKKANASYEPSPPSDPRYHLAPSDQYAAGYRNASLLRGHIAHSQETGGMEVVGNALEDDKHEHEVFVQTVPTPETASGSDGTVDSMSSLTDVNSQSCCDDEDVPKVHSRKSGNWTEGPHKVTSWTPGATCPIAGLGDLFVSENPLFSAPLNRPKNRPFPSRPMTARLKTNAMTVVPQPHKPETLAWGKESPLAMEWGQFKAATTGKK